MDSELTVQDDIESGVEHGLADNIHTTNVSLQTLTIADCAALADQIRQALAIGNDVVLDLGNCQEVDTAGIQLLVILQNDPVVNLRVHWTKPSEVVAMKAARLGVQSWINAGFLEH